MTSNQAVVLANGEIRDLAVIHKRLEDWQDALVVAADGAARFAVALGLQVAAVLGDLDSIDQLTRSVMERSGAELSVFPSRKDELDLELALMYAVDHGAQRIAVLGVMGGRMDMAVANVHLLLHARLRGLRVELWNGPQTAWVILPPGDTVTGQPGDTLSLLPLGCAAVGVATEGLEYPLHDETLEVGVVRGISNVLLGQQARIRIRDGSLLAVHTPGRA